MQMSSGDPKETKGEEKTKKMLPTNQEVQPFGNRTTCGKQAITLAVRNV